MKRNRTILLIILHLLLFCQLSGQNNNINFRRISPPGGFTLKAISTISQDSLGYIWMGTGQGLIRYHSNNISWFVPNAKDTLSLLHKSIYSVKTDKNKNLWICTRGGLCKFNSSSQNFIPINYTYENGSAASKIVLTITEINNRLLLIDNTYIGYLNLANKQLERIAINELSNPRVCFAANNKQVWIGTNAGEVYLLNTETNKVQKIIDAKGSRVNTIYADNNGIWVGYEAHGACKYSLSGELLHQYEFPETPNQNTINTRVRKILKDSKGRLWIGAYEGLFVHDGTRLVRFGKVKYPGIPHSSVFEIYQDKEGSVWIGTWAGGVTLAHHSDNSFKTYRHHELLNSVTNNMISSFVQLNNKELLIGTEFGGLNKLNLKTEEFNRIKINDLVDVENIKSMCKDKNETLWIGTFRQGLWYRQKNKSKFQQYLFNDLDDQFSRSARFYALLPTDSGVWIGNYGSGIAFYSFNNQTVTFPFHSMSAEINMNNLHVNCLYPDSKSNLWVGASEGTIKIHLPTRKISSIQQQNITQGNPLIANAFWEDDSGNIWIGTNNKGILKFEPKSDSLQVFSANGMLDNKDVYGFIEDQNHNLWITSNNGLIVYNHSQNTTRQFVYSDGIQSNLFTPQAVYKDVKGNLYFGGTNGFTSVDPTKIKTNSRKPITTIHQLVANNKNTYYPIYQQENKIETIQLKPTENNFRISFSADNYLMPEKNQYKYRLINNYDEWIDSNEGSVLFTDIDAGEYTFEVIACNNDGIWNINPTQLQISIDKIWYKTNLAYLLYIFIFSLIVFFVFRFYYERIKLKRAVLKEKNQRENEEQIHEMKLKFFTNISHEFRTPLSLISWPLKRLLQENNLTNEQREELEIVNRNSSRLLQLINQLLDIRKLEKGKSRLNLTKFDIVPFINEMHTGFSGEDKSKEIKFELESDFTSYEIEADRDKFDIILYNLLSNAYKYSPKKSEISVRIGNPKLKKPTNYANQLSFGKLETDDYVEIAVEDSGSGIDSEDLLNVFNRFEQGKQRIISERKINGSGIGLSICKDYTLLHNGVIKAQSNIGKGSCFTIQLPRKQKAQAILFQSHQEFKNLKKTDKLITNPKIQKKQNQQHEILVVEDNTELRKLIVNFLSKFYKVDFACDGLEALNKLKNKNIDLVVSDVMMPEMDGFEFCGLVKTQVETSHIPVILLTALSNTDNLIVGLENGADAYLTKPFDENVLHIQIENILEQRRRIHENFNKQFVSQKTLEVGSLDNFFLKRVRTVVEKNLMNENFGMEQLADELMISRSQLHRKIKSISGTTTTEFVNLVRIKKAVELINNGNYLFSEIAFKVGFNNQSYFNKCFKKVYNVSPKEYFSEELKMAEN